MSGDKLKRRSGIEITVAVLSAISVNGGDGRTTVMRKANMDFPRTIQTIRFLKSNGLIEEKPSGMKWPKTIFSLTMSGRQILSVYRAIEPFISPDFREPERP